jgi:hypothetical protein
MNKLTFLALPALLSGCAFASQFGITPQSAPVLAAIAVEGRASANCVREREAGRPLSALHAVRIGHARIGFDVTVGMTLSEAVRSRLDESRALTDEVCPPPVPRVTAPLEASVPVEPTP